MGNKRSLGFCIKNNMLRAGDTIKFESGWESVIKEITPNDVKTTNGSVFDFSTKIYPPKKPEQKKNENLRSVTVTIKCITFHEYTISAKDIQDGLTSVEATPRWTALKDSEIIDYDKDSFEIESVVIN